MNLPRLFVKIDFRNFVPHLELSRSMQAEGGMATLPTVEQEVALADVLFCRVSRDATPAISEPLF
jgi:hypothetical protein